MVEKFGSHIITLLYPNQCNNEMCYKGTAQEYNTFVFKSTKCNSVGANILALCIINTVH